MRNSFKMLLGAAAVGSFALVGCMNTGSGPATQNADLATLDLSVKTSPVNAGGSALAKGRYDSLAIDSLYIKLTSQGSATTLDTIVVWVKPGTPATLGSYKATSGNLQATVFPSLPTFNLSSNAYIEQALPGFKFNLKALRDWKIEIGTVVSRGSFDTVQFGSATVTNLFAGQVRNDSIFVAPNFESYQANFKFPDSIVSPSSSGKQYVLIKRVKFYLANGGTELSPAALGLVGDSAVVDSARLTAPGFDTVSRALVYSRKLAGAPAVDSLIVRVFGTLPQAVNDPGTVGTNYTTGEHLLYEGGINIASLGLPPTTNSLPLAWTGPARGTVDTLKVTIGKVGLHVLNVQTPNNVLDKKASK